MLWQDIVFLIGFMALVSFGCKNAVEKQLIEVARLNELQNKTLEIIEHNKLQIEVEKIALLKCEKPFLDEAEVIVEKMTKDLAASLWASRSNFTEDKQLMDRVEKYRDLTRLIKSLAKTRAQIYCDNIYVKIARLEKDLRLSNTVYDSINALHTNAVFELSKMQSKF